MNIVVVKNFFAKTKQNKKEIIVWGIVIWAVTTLLLNPGIDFLWSTLGPHPKIVSNIIVFKNANISCCEDNQTQMKDFVFFYYLGEGYSTLFFINATAARQVKGYDMSLLPTRPPCDDCTVYSFSLMNDGNGKAESVVIDIKSLSEPELIIDNPKMVNKECGGLYESAGCYIELTNINEGEETNFALSTKNPSDLFILSCLANGRYDCEFRFLNIWAQTIDPKKDVLIMDGKKVIFPTLDNSEPNKFYYFEPSQFDEGKTAWTYYQES